MNGHIAPRVFVSYARSDGEEFAHRLRKQLEQENIPLWQDRVCMEGGRDWWLQITEALDQVEFMVLVMTPNALASDTVRREWRYARQQGVCVYPVKARPDLDFSVLPRWMSSPHYYDLDHEWDKFIQDLNTRCRKHRVPFIQEEVPEGFVERPDLFKKICSHLIDDSGNPIPSIVALCGAGGYGKTSMALHVSHNDEIQTVFDDGILLLRLRENHGDLIGYVQDVIYTISGERPGFTGIEAATAKMMELISERDILILIDDVWNINHLKPFIQSGKRCARLITTCNVGILPTNAIRIDVSKMLPNEAANLLGTGLPREEDDAIRSLAKRLCEWPLLLKLANGTLRERVINRHEPLHKALDYVDKALGKKGPTVFDPKDVDAQNRAVANTIEISLAHLTPDDLMRFSELAIFPEDGNISLSVVEKLWERTGNLDCIDTEQLVGRLSSLSLLPVYDLATRHIRLHDSIRLYLVNTIRSSLQHIHRTLIETCRPHSEENDVDAWASLPENEPYFWDNLAYHLNESGNSEELHRLLLSFRWLHKKLGTRDLESVINDYNYLRENPSFRLIQSSLRLSARVLSADPDQVASQLIGRLMTESSPEVAEMMDQARKWDETPWLCPLAQSLTSPGKFICGSLKGHAELVSGVAIFKNGRRAISASKDNRLIIWDLDNYTQLHVLEGHSGCVNSVIVTADEKRAISTSHDKTLKVWDLDQMTEIITLKGHRGWVRAVAVSADGTRAVSGCSCGELKVWDLEKWEAVITIQAHTEPVRSVALTSDGKMAISASSDTTLNVWDTESGSKLHTLRGHTGWVNGVTLTRDGRRAISASSDKTIILWDLENYDIIRTLTGHKETVYDVKVTPDNKRIVSCSMDETIILWDLHRDEDPLILSGHMGFIFSVAVSPCGNRLVSASLDKMLNVWDLSSDRESTQRNDHGFWVSCLSIMHDTSRVISASGDHTLKIWDMETLSEITVLAGHQNFVNSVTVTPDGSRAISASADTTLMVWDLERYTPVRTLRGHENYVFVVMLSPDGKKAFSGSSDRTIIMWDIETGEAIHTFRAHSDAVKAMAITPDGAHLVSASADKSIRVWDVTTGNEIFTLNHHSKAVKALALTPDGRKAVSASADSTLAVWDLERGKLLHHLKGHGGPVNSVAITESNGTTCAISASKDGSLKLWDIENGCEMATLVGHTKEINMVTLSPDGHCAASVSEDQSLLFWNVEKQCKIAGFTLDYGGFCCALTNGGNRIVAGDYGGHLHLLTLKGS